MKNSVLLISIISIPFFGGFYSFALADSVVVFNEIMYHPAAGADETLEWVELYNQMALDVDISGWKVKGGIDHTFAEGTILAGGGYLILAKSPVAFEAKYGYSGAVGPYDGQLSNSGELLQLVNNSGRLMNQVEYNDRGDWPVAADGSGATLAKRYPDASSMQAENWTSSVTVGGTPGTENFPSIEPPQTPAVSFSEIAPANSGSFWLELVYTGSGNLDLSGIVISVDGQSTGAYTFTSRIVVPGQYITVTGYELGFTPADGDRLFLYNVAGDEVMDAVVVTDTLQGRSAPMGCWYFPSFESPGSGNVFEFNTDIVINEIMYHKGDIPAVEGEYATIKLVSAGAPAKTLVPQDDSMDLEWTGSNEPFDDSGWTDGIGTTTGIGYDERGDYNSDIGTNIYVEAYNDNRSVYVRIPFDLATVPVTDSMTLAMKYDDGFVAYLNGVEVARRNAPEDLTWNSPASASHESTGYEHIDISSYIGLLKSGENILAVHGLNINLTSSDFLILPELFFYKQITEPIAGGELPEEWVELYNKGASIVNLTGWKLDNAVDYDFPDDTTINPGEYLVVAKDSALMRLQYPSIAVVGDYSGNLGNKGDLIELIDAAGNPADEVRYYDDQPWPLEADGYNSSLELRDPYADNTNAQSWAASDESIRSEWQTYTYRGIAQSSSASAADSQWREFVVGLLDAGEILIDDMSVIEDPDGSRIELLQNGTFETSPGDSKWRNVGTHRHSLVIEDPDNVVNHILRLIATGPTEHMHNHLETTLANGRSVVNGREYEITFRAKWISGSNQLNTRLYFNRLGRTTLIEKPVLNGTPGMQNRRYQTNIGPSLSGLSHYPAVPEASESVIVSVFGNDPDGINTIMLNWRVDGQTWNQTLMTFSGYGVYQAIIAGQPAGTIVQFYAQATDTVGGVSTLPAKGGDSRAMYRVNDSQAAVNGLHNFRLILTDADYTWMHQDHNVMSNDRIAATVIYDESRIYYDVGVRLKGSQRHRTPDDEVGCNVAFHADNLFRGVHKTVAIDRSEGIGFGQREMLIYQAANHAGVIASKYHDLIKFIPNQAVHTSSAELQLARYNDEFLSSTFDNGSDGTLYEYELVYYPKTTIGGEEDYKKPLPDSVTGTEIRNLGPDKEAYRWFYLLKNNRSNDSFDDLIDFVASFGDTDNLENVIDVSAWLSSFAIAVASGTGDNYGGSGASHNAMLYIRPSDGKVIFLPHDMDLGFSVTRSIDQNDDLRRMISVPAYERLYYGHLYHLLTSSFNLDYMSRVADNFGQLLPEQPFSSHLSFIGQRSDYLLGQIAGRVAAQYPFAITDPDMVVPDAYAQIHGQSWIDMKELYLDGIDEPLELSWTSTGNGTSKKFFFVATVPVDPGVNTLTFKAYDFQNRLIATHTMTVTSTTDERPLRDFLRVTELMFDPAGGSDYEFIELCNTSGQTLDLTDVKFSDGISFAFATGSVTSLEPGEYVLVVKNLAAFSNRYAASGMNIAGEFSGKLNNDGETITLEGKWGSKILSLTYDDKRGWPLAACGAGHSLVPVYSAIEDQSDGSADFGGNWRTSGYINGSPGAADPEVTKTVLINEICANTDYGVWPHESNDWVELYNALGYTVQLYSEWYLSDDKDNLAKYALPTSSLSGYSYISYDQVNHFNTDGTGPEGFGLNKAGERLFLSYLPGNAEDRVVDCVRFKGQPSGFSLSRYPDGGDYWYETSTSRDLTNAVPAPVCVISEFMYHPETGDKEFIELKNLTSAPLSLWDGDPTVQHGWRLDGGISFEFGAEDAIAPNGFLLVVGFNPNETNLAAFNSRYGATLTDGQVVGPYFGDLDNHTERIALERPQASDDPLSPGDLSWIILDEAIYFDQAPWPYDTDGTGQSAQRKELTVSGNAPDNWQAKTPTPGYWVSRTDFSGNGTMGLEDLIIFSQAWLSETGDINWNNACDISSPVDGVINLDDFAELASMWLVNY